MFCSVHSTASGNRFLELQKKVPLPNGLPGNTKLVKVVLVKRGEQPTEKAGHGSTVLWGPGRDSPPRISLTGDSTEVTNKSGGHLHPLMIQPGLS